MKIDTFLKKYGAEKEKDNYVMGVINNNYVPYVTKVSDCERIINSCYFKDVLGKRRFYINSPAKSMMFVLLLVSRYTSIDIDFSPEIYDKLQSSGALTYIVKNIPEYEYKEYSSLMHMTENDFIMNENSLVSRFDDLKQAVEVAVERFFTGVESALDSQDESNGEEQISEL